MAKFLRLWEMDTTKVPDKPEERYENWVMMLNMIKENIESGKIKEWGLFAGTLEGYCIGEGTEQEIDLQTKRFVPYIKFKVYPVISVDQALENVKALSQA